MSRSRVLAIAALAASLVAVSPAYGRCANPKSKLPYWARAHTMTVLNDSVLLSGESALRRGMPCWRIHLIGRPALMLPAADHEIRAKNLRVAPLVVVGIGYNTLWQRNRYRHGYWAARFDRESRHLLHTLFTHGAQQIVWVTLRRANRKTTRPNRWGELSQYSWYFPYVNERLRALDKQRNRVVLARWDRTGARPDVTYDTIHLNELGGRLMQRLIEKTIYNEAVRQARRRARAAQNPCANIKTAAPRRRPGRPRPPLFIGDSSSLLAVAPLAGHGIEANSRGCRPLSDAVRIMFLRKRAGTLPRVVVLGEGANGGIQRSLLRRALRIAGPRRMLGLVTTTVPSSAARAMRTFHAAHPRRTLLIDWAASGIPQRYGGDGLHIGYAGEAVMARYIAARVRPYTPPKTAIRFTTDEAKAKECGSVHPGGRNLQVFVLRGRDRVLCARARQLARTREKAALRGFRWYDWRFLGRGAWKDVFVRPDGRVVIAARTPA
jgi:hypothetical protein